MASKPSGKSADTPERAIKTLLLTDLVDSTALVHALGDYRVAVVFEQHDLIARDLLVKHKGIEIDKTDGFLFLFDRPIEATLYVLAFHEALAALSREVGVEFAARAGIHLGEVVLRKNKPKYVARGAKPVELEGLAKPTAARVMSLAQGKQTLMTRSAFDLARRAVVGHEGVPDDVVWIDHGLYNFKGIVEAHSVCEVGRKSRAPLAAPPNTEKAWRATERRTEEAVGWRPAAGLAIPDRPRWKLESRIGEGSHGEIWLASTVDMAAEATITNGADVRVIPPRDGRAFLFCLNATGQGSTGRPGWHLHDPIACLVIASGGQEGEYAIIAGPRFRAGRDRSMELQIKDRLVSRQHFELREDGRSYVVRELRAKNGVLVNGFDIEGEKKLENGDELQVGDTKLVFYVDPDRSLLTGTRTCAKATRSRSAE